MPIKRIYAFYTDLKTNLDHFPLQHYTDRFSLPKRIVFSARYGLEL